MINKEFLTKTQLYHNLKNLYLVKRDLVRHKLIKFQIISRFKTL